MTESQLMDSITDEELKYLAVDVMDFHEIGGFKEGAMIVDIIEKVKSNFEMTDEEALHSTLYMLTLEIIERYSKELNVY
jgi:hypothetical protein